MQIAEERETSGVSCACGSIQHEHGTHRYVRLVRLDSIAGMVPLSWLIFKYLRERMSAVYATPRNRIMERTESGDSSGWKALRGWSRSAGCYAGR